MLLGTFILHSQISMSMSMHTHIANVTHTYIQYKDSIFLDIFKNVDVTGIIIRKLFLFKFGFQFMVFSVHTLHYILKYL